MFLQLVLGSDYNQMGLFNFVSGFAIGLYTGLYVAKNYNIPDIPDPGSMYNKLLKVLEENKKDKKD